MIWEVTVSANDKQPFVNLDDLKDEYGHDTKSYALCLPKYSKLNGDYTNTPNVMPTVGTGYMSTKISNENGLFSTPVWIDFKFARPKTSKGIKFVFNTLSGDYCSDLVIEWYRLNELVDTKEFYPTSSEYVCVNSVGQWDEVKVYFKNTSKPYRYLWVSLFDNSALTQTEGLRIIYNDLAVGSENIVSASSTNKKSYSNLKLLTAENSEIPKVAFLLPRYSKLDGNYANTADISKEGISYISESISDDKCNFASNPVVTFSFTEKISSVGLTLTFNNHSGDYCSDLLINWYANNQVIATKEYYLNDYSYFCYNVVDYYDKVTIEFKKTSKPFRNIFLASVLFGVKRIYTEKDIIDCNCFMEISPISDELSINTLSFDVRKEDDYEFDFQKRQLIQLYFDQQIYGNFYLKSGKKSNAYTHTISAEDVVSILDTNSYVGGIFNGQTAKEVIDDIFKGETFQYYIDDELQNKKVYGYLPYDSKRKCLALVCFAIGGIVDTSFDERLFIYPLNTTKERDIKLSSIYSSNGLSIKNDDIVTGVNLTVHKYVASKERSTELYKDVLNGEATIIFNTPYHSLTITGGTISKSGPNYAVIKGTGAQVILTGFEYSDETQVLTMDNANIYRNKKYVEVKDVTTITSENASEILSRIYDYYTQNESVSATILMGRNEIGSVVEIDTEFDGKRKGIIQSAQLSFTSEVKGDIEIKCLQ